MLTVSTEFTSFFTATSPWQAACLLTDLEGVADLGAALGEAVVIVAGDGADEVQLLVETLCSPRFANPRPPFRAAAGFLRRADYLIALVGRDALRAAWPYSPSGDSRYTLPD